MYRYILERNRRSGSGSANVVVVVVGPYQHDRVTRIPSSRVPHVAPSLSRYLLISPLFSSARLTFSSSPTEASGVFFRFSSASPFGFVPLGFSRPLESFATFVRSLGCQCWALGMRGGFVSSRLSLAPTLLSLSSLARINPPLPLLSLHPLSLLANAAASIYLCLPRFPPSLSLARLIDPDPVLFSSLFDSRAGLYHRLTPAASRRQGLPEGAEARGARDIEVNAGSAEGTGEDRSDAQVPRYTFSFHLPGALSEIETEEEREKEKKGAPRSRGGVRKNFRPFPSRSASGLPLISVRLRESRESEFATSRERRSATKTRCVACARVAFLRLSSRDCVASVRR